MIEIIPLTPDDAEELTFIHQSFELPWEKPWSLKSYQELLQTSQITGLKTLQNQKISGYILAQKAYDTADILFIGVRPEIQSQGIGGQLLKHLERVLLSHGIKEVFLEVYKNNTIAVDFYKTYRYFNVSLRKNYYNTDLGTFDAILMKKDLLHV